MQHQTVQWEVELTLLPAERGRQSAIGPGYRPNHQHPLTGEYFMGQFSLEGPMAPGEVATVRLTVLASAPQIEGLLAVRAWTIWEGPRQVGSVRLLNAV